MVVLTNCRVPSMAAQAFSNPVIARFRAALRDVYGDRLEHVVSVRLARSWGCDAELRLRHRRLSARCRKPLGGKRAAAESRPLILFATAHSTRCLFRGGLPRSNAPYARASPRHWRDDRDGRGNRSADLAKARQSPKEARIRRPNNLPEAAARGLSGARLTMPPSSLIFDRTGRAAKTHRGVRGEFARLAKDDPRSSEHFRLFVARAYRLKEAADYAVGPRRARERVGSRRGD